MAESPIATPAMLHLAKRIEADIQSRQLSSGDRYLTVAQVAQMLRVSKLSANQAMQLLVHRRVLDRRQRRGTFVAEPAAPKSRQPIEFLMLLVHKYYMQSEGLLANGILLGISRRLPGVDLRFCFSTDVDEAAHVRQMLDDTLRRQRRSGLLLVRASLATQRQVAASGLPAVIFGMPQPSVTELSWIDADQQRSGRLLAEHLLSRGHRRLVVLMRERMLPGDHPFLDGIREVVAEAQLPVDALLLRELPTDDHAIVSEVRQVLTAGGSQPGFIARSEQLGLRAIETIDAMGLSPDGRSSVAIATLYRRGNENPPPCAYIRVELSPQEQGEMIASLLCHVAETGVVKQVKLPVCLVTPETGP